MSNGNDTVPQPDDSSLDLRLETYGSIENNMSSQRDGGAPADESDTRENVHETNMNRASSIDASLMTAAGQSSVIQSSSNHTRQSPRLQTDMASSSDNNNNSRGNESGTTSSSSATKTQLGQHVHFVPNSVGMIPAQEAHFPPMATHSTALTQLLQLQAQTQAGTAPSHGSLINQLSSIQPPSSLSQLQITSRDMQQALSSTADLPASTLNQLSSVPTLSSLAGLSPNIIAQLQELSSLSSLNASLIGHLELTSLAQNVTGLHNTSQAQAQALPYHQQSLLDQLAAAQANQNSSSPPSQSTTELINAYLLRNQRTDASLNPPITPFPPQAQYQSQQQLIHRLIQENAVKDRIIALLLSRQQAGAPNNDNTSAHQPLSPLLAASPSPISQQSPLITSNSVAFSGRPNAANQVSSVHVVDPDKSSEPKDNRWMARYEELKQFQQVRIQ